MDINLATLNNTQGFRILGENSNDYSGISVSSAGDVNGDGYADVIIGANGATNITGKSYVLFGKSTGFSDLSLSALTPTQGFRILGENSNDYSGWSVSSAGDVNKDGFADIIVGAWGATNRAGKSYVIFGKSTGFSDLSLSTLTPTQGFRILGESANNLSGSSVSDAGDVNGDGYADVIIGAPYAGKSYVIFGKSTGFSDINLSTLTSTQGFRILEESAGDQSGWSVSGAGDVNKDGFADVIIGAPYATNIAGKSYIIFGNSTSFSDINLSTLSPTQGFRILDENDYNDVNKDGFADVIIGTPYATNIAGKSYVIFGKSTGFSDINLSTLTPTQGFRILGESSNDYSGWSVSSAGDVNGDSYVDIIIGAKGATSNAGKSYVIFGKSSDFSDINLSTLTPTQGFRILGENTGDESGYFVSNAGDVNKDGFADVIIGAPYATNTGNSYVLFGKSTGFSDLSLSTLNSTQGFRILGESTGDESGWSVSTAEDLNGDGYADIIIGADTAISGAGKSYALFAVIPLQVTADNVTTTYGTPPILTASYTGFVNSESPANLTSLPTIETKATSISTPGDYLITVSGGASSHYYFIYTNGLLTINKAPLLVTANDTTTTYGTLSSLTLNYSGFVNSEDPSNLLAQPIASTTANITSSPADYPITVSGGASNNYAFIYIDGILTINKASLIVTANNATTTYGAIPPLTESYSGFVNSEDPSNLITQPIASTTANITSSPADYPITVSSGVSNNYAFIYIDGVLTINKAPLLVTANNATTTYGTIPLLTESYSGFVNSENPLNLLTQPIASTTANITSSPADYPITVSGGVSNNYAFIYADGVLTINKTLLVVTANDATTIYGTIPLLTESYSGFVNSESALNLLTQPIASTTANVTSSPADYPITVSGGVSNNYAFTYIDGVLTINKASLLVIANDATTTYGILPPLKITYSGFVNSEDSSNLLTQPTPSTTANITSSPADYPIIASGGVSDNYDFNYIDGYLTINKALLTVTANNVIVTYGDTIPALTLNYTGFVNSESPSNLLTQPIASTTATSTSQPGDYLIKVSGGASDNYDFNYIDGYVIIQKGSSSDDSSSNNFLKIGMPILFGLGAIVIIYTIYKCKKENICCFKNPLTALLINDASGTERDHLLQPSGMNYDPPQTSYTSGNENGGGDQSVIDPEVEVDGSDLSCVISVGHYEPSRDGSLHDVDII